MERVVGEDASLARLALPDDRGLVAPRPGEVAVETVVGDVEPRSQRVVQRSRSAISAQKASGSSTERR